MSFVDTIKESTTVELPKIIPDWFVDAKQNSWEQNQILNKIKSDLNTLGVDISNTDYTAEVFYHVYNKLYLKFKN